MKQILDNPELLVAVDVDPDMDYPCSKCVLHRFCEDHLDQPIECMAHKRVDGRSVYFITQENEKSKLFSMKQILDNPELLVAVDVDPDMDYPCSKCVLHRFCEDHLDQPIECMAHKRVDGRSVYFITQENEKERK